MYQVSRKRKTIEAFPLTKSFFLYIIFCVALRGVPMLLEIKKLLCEQGVTKDFSYSFESNLFDELGVGKPEKTVINVTGTAQNTLGFLTLTLQAQFELPYLCDRCLKDSAKEFSFSFSHELSQESYLEKEEAIYLNEDGLLDIDQLIIGNIGLSLPSKFLCEEDCEGLCPICGVNKNNENCDCTTNEIDPRLEALKELLK